MTALLTVSSRHYTQLYAVCSCIIFLLVGPKYRYLLRTSCNSFKFKTQSTLSFIHDCSVSAVIYLDFSCNDTMAFWLCNVFVLNCREYIIWVSRDTWLWVIQVAVAIISLAETSLLTYLGYKVGL